MLSFTPVPMTEPVMADLQARGLILRLTPEGHRFAAEAGQCRDSVIYRTAPCFGSHMLISVVVNRFTFDAFGTHPDNEDFILLGSNEDKPLFLLISLTDKETLKAKLAAGTAVQEDFICLRCRFNDPQLSFFTMLGGVPHGEATQEDDGVPPKFYVTEPSELGSEEIKLGPHRIQSD